MTLHLEGFRKSAKIFAVGLGALALLLACVAGYVSGEASSALKSSYSTTSSKYSTSLTSSSLGMYESYAATAGACTSLAYATAGGSGVAILAWVGSNLLIAYAKDRGDTQAAS